MLEYVTGKLTLKQPHRVVIEVQGIGLELLVPFSTSKELPATGQEVRLLSHLNWRQDDGPQLLGFLSQDEREMFRALINVNKVGPKLALNIMSTTTPEILATMILSEDHKKLKTLKGVGPKLASRLVVELKDEIIKLGLGGGDLENMEVVETPVIPHEDDVREALTNLGYSNKEIEACLQSVAKNLPQNATIETIIGAVLQSFNS
jgi:Holliday junction DNA helicase RuvA